MTTTHEVYNGVKPEERRCTITFTDVSIREAKTLVANMVTSGPPNSRISVHFTEWPREHCGGQLAHAPHQWTTMVGPPGEESEQRYQCDGLPPQSPPICGREERHVPHWTEDHGRFCGGWR